MTARPRRPASQAGSSGSNLARWSGDTIELVAAQQLLDALSCARATDAPRALAAAEDAVFRFYLPLARSMAEAEAVRLGDRVGVDQAAELGLAQAVLGWRGSHASGFERFARTVMTARLRLMTAAPAGLYRPPPSSLPAPAGGDHCPAPGVRVPESWS